jgi:glycosyltransferase involved in cell wall biosynthesis
MPAGATVRVTARNIVPCDAVGNFAVSTAEFYKQHGVEARLYSHEPHPELSDQVAPYRALDSEAQPRDILFHNFSTEDELLPHILTLPWARKILYYHNVTPGHWFRECNPEIADLLDRAREQFTLFSAFDAAYANSQYSLKEILPYLRPGMPVAVLPPSLAPGRLVSLDPEPVMLPEAEHIILWVGRLAPHKRPELALELFERLYSDMPDLALIMVCGGRRDFPDYAARIDARTSVLPEVVRNRVSISENVSDRQLAWLYRHSSLLLCTSGHEGYCLSVAEAMSFGLPVAAFHQEAVEETLNGYGMILPENEGEAVIALTHLLRDGAVVRKVPVSFPADMLQIWMDIL